MAACSPSSGSKSGAEARSGTATRTAATMAKTLRRLSMRTADRTLSPLDQCDERVVIRSVLAIGAAQVRAPALGKAEEQMIEPHRPEGRPPVLAGGARQLSGELAIRSIAVAEPRIQIAAENDGSLWRQRLRQRARLTQPPRLRQDPGVVHDHVREVGADEADRERGGAGAVHHDGRG